MANVKATKKVKDVVISKIEITKLTPKSQVDARSISLQQYHSEIAKMGREITKYALSLSDNLLSVKMALMQSVQETERKMRENKQL